MRQILAGFSSFYNRFGNLPFVGILVFIAVFIWINGNALFPDWDEGYGQLIIYYFVMMLIFLAFAARGKMKDNEIMATPLWIAGRAFGVFFLGTWAVMQIIIMLGLLVPPEFPLNLFWQTILLQFCVIAVCEEVIFRGALLSSLHKNFKSITVAIVGSAVAFAVWHIYAYQIILYDANLASLNWFSLMFAFVMGLVLAVIAINKRWGIGGAIAVHGTVNLMILGVLVL